MTFAQVPKEAFFDPYLKGLRFEIFAAVILEMFESGVGVCRLTVTEMAEKYPHFSPDNFARTRKQMIKDGYLIEVVGGIVTTDFNTTAKNAVEIEVEGESALRKTQSTAKIAVIPDETTAKIAETNCENRRNDSCSYRNLDFKEDLNTNTAGAQTARAREQFPLAEFYESFPGVNLTGDDEILIINSVRPDDKAAWLATIKRYEKRCNRLTGSYLPEKTNNFLSVFRAERKKLANKVNKNGSVTTNAKPNGKLQTIPAGRLPANGNGDGERQLSNSEILRGRDYDEFDGFDPIAAFAED